MSSLRRFLFKTVPSLAINPSDCKPVADHVPAFSVLALIRISHDQSTAVDNPMSPALGKEK